MRAAALLGAGTLWNSISGQLPLLSPAVPGPAWHDAGALCACKFRSLAHGCEDRRTRQAGREEE